MSEEGAGGHPGGWHAHERHVLNVNATAIEFVLGSDDAELTDRSAQPSHQHSCSCVARTKHTVRRCVHPALPRRNQLKKLSVGRVRRGRRCAGPEALEKFSAKIFIIYIESESGQVYIYKTTIKK